MKALAPMALWARQALPWRQAMAVHWHRHLGRPAWVALALLVAGGLVQWQLRPLLLHEQARLAVRQQALATVPSAAAVSAASPREPLQVNELPTPRQRGRDLEWLVMAAQRSGLALDRADYAIGAATGGGVSRVEATLPLSGTYGALRGFVADVLNGLPHSALESLQVERANTQSPQLQATARLVLFYREEAP